MIVREFIHHGDFRNVRSQSIEPTFAGIVTLLQASPLTAGTKTLAEYAGNRYVLRLASDLLATGRGDFGWATYEVLEK